MIDYAKAAGRLSSGGARTGGAAGRCADRSNYLEEVIGSREARGGTINGGVHAVRLPSYAASVDALFTVPGSRLILKHDAGTDASIYAEGTLLAARRVTTIVGLVRGLDRLLFPQE